MTASEKDAPSRDDLLRDLALTKERTLEWMDAHLTDGVPDCDPSFVYRLPYALSLAGRRTQAVKVLDWIDQSSLDRTGDFAAGAAQEAFESAWATYPLTLISQGAWHLERFDLAEKVFAVTRTYQDERSGGVRTGRGLEEEGQLQELSPTAQFGITALALGHRDAAARVVGWLRSILEAQPAPNERLYTAMRAGELVTATDEDETFRLVTEFRRPRQAFYNPGIAAAFLARWAAASGDLNAADLAEEYLSLSRQATKEQFNGRESVQICKYGWGAAALLDLGRFAWSGEAERMGRWFVETQYDDGHWENSPFLLPNGSAIGNTWEITSEFLQHIIVLSTSLISAR